MNDTVCWRYPKGKVIGRRYNCMLFDSYVIIKEPGHIELHTERLVQFKNKYSENIQNGTPKWWDEYVLQNIDVDDYHIYFICSCTVPEGKYNRITDYKKIWGLNGLDKGIYDNAYMNRAGKVYFGIFQAHGETAFRSSTASTILLTKKECKFVCKDIFELFKRYQYDFRNQIDSKDLMTQVCMLNKGSILLRYSCIGEISLNIYGENVEHQFSDMDVSKYNEREAEVIYRRP